MSSVGVTPEQFTRSTSWGRYSISEENQSPKADESGFPQTAGAYPSPYRTANAAAFADINRALARRSLKDSVYASPHARQVYLRSLSCPAPDGALAPVMESRNVGLASSKAIDSRTLPVLNERSNSLPVGFSRPVGQRRAVSENYESVGQVRRSSVSGAGVDPGRDEIVLPRPSGEVTSPTTESVGGANTKRLSRGKRPTGCIVM
ncbi:Reovirus sigma C capsid domain-containing protein [Ceratobasidium theobromae]|uniref:Reovirus sigma C capsid domain-containing protein n=1 Tax=Ceratobasidium theobromae TaxID=1582974 RepID=A0A5N5QHV5_9AGAM|nr:Reovirus sigma C capsid domain-containing protein [Ceratobasidium theobromae]